MVPEGTSIITCPSVPSSSCASFTTTSPASESQAITKGPGPGWRLAMALLRGLLRIDGKMIVDAHHAVLALGARCGNDRVLLRLHRAGEVVHAAVAVHRDIRARHRGSREQARADACGHHRTRKGDRR